MKNTCLTLWLSLSLLPATGCGERTPLDRWEAGQPAGSVVSGASPPIGVVSGASANSAGSLATGGQRSSDSRGGQVDIGGRGSAGGLPLGGTGGQVVGSGRGGAGGSGALAGTGAAGSGGTNGPSSCPVVAPNEDLIDDMNDGDRFIPQVNGRVGAWLDSDDNTPGSTMFPDPMAPFAMTWTGDSCRQYAAYVYGGPFVDSGADFWFGLGSPYNASAYQGITFWAKIDSGTWSGLRVAFPDKDTDPDGGICRPNVAGPTQCYDHYGSRLTLTTDWKKYEVDFTSLSQDGWGLAARAFDPTTVYQVVFQIPVNANFGIWIDDVAFVRLPAS